MNRIKEYWIDYFQKIEEEEWWSKKQTLWEKRDGKIVSVQGSGRKYEMYAYDDYKKETYLLYLAFLIKQQNRFHLEEQVIPYEVQSRKGKIVKHRVKEELKNMKFEGRFTSFPRNNASYRNRDFPYDRREAVRYAEHWWNDYNPEFPKFSNDCTNYVSQCLYYGGAPMRGAPHRDKGWWCESDNWSLSWSVTHSLRWYLSGSTEGLQGKEVEDPKELRPGDVICYDFQGDERWDHAAIVVRHDAYGMPLVNAHTDNSRNRYWSYEDSIAWTQSINYKFFKIGE